MDEKKIHEFGTNRGECYKFSINHCESHVKSGLDTISLSIDSRDLRKLKFLVDTGAEISIIKSSSLTAGVEYQLCEGVDIKGISNTIMKTEGTIDLKLFTDTQTTHTFYVLRENPELPYDAILGKDFFESKESVINYCSRQIIMNDEVILNFDPKPTANKTEPCRLTLKARTEMIEFRPLLRVQACYLRVNYHRAYTWHLL
jgi:hypothetical protein